MESQNFISSAWKNIRVMPMTKTLDKAVFVISPVLQKRVEDLAKVFGYSYSLELDNQLVVNFN